ncbi:SLC13 family permease [Vibrio sp. La 4.2.2]|uniref:SLC13 family permease n=1 Tax=Vibrio sp. La 4.2.2 TaxID=2998830 RepID=UPI0022CDCE8B|nr:SLC13 family permease [Vibrio sp. La 4.2.2]MDA0110543.1 SLC13 family permease [Vibrio sp. La 4.2.2]
MLITALVIVGLLTSLVCTRYRSSLLFIGAILVLYVTGQISQASILTNITNTSVLTLVALMLASLALERSDLLVWMSSKIFHPSYKQTVVRMGVSTAISSALLNNTAVVATLMGSVLRNQEHSPSKLLMPLSYFAIIGGTMTLIGTSTNLVINAVLVDHAVEPLRFFSFTPIGLVILVFVGAAIALACGSLSSHDQVEKKDKGYFIDAEVGISSKLIGHTVRQNKLRSLDGLFLAEIVRGKQLISPVTPDTVIEGGDKLIFTGEVENLKQLSELDGVEVFAETNELLESNLTEVIVSSESVLVGKTLKSTDFRSRFDAAVVAINRENQRLSGKLGEQRIQAGDKLVLAVGQDFHKRQNISRNFYILSGIQLNNRLTKAQNWMAVAGFVAAILVSVATPLSLLETVAAYLLAMVGCNILDSTTIRRRFPFELWLILVCALSIAQAFSQSGLAQFITATLYELLGEQSPYIALIVAFLVTVLLTEVITNTAAAAIMLPIGLSLANIYQVSAMPFIMAVAYAASACFISPYGYQTNLMVMNAGGYTFKDFIRVGWKVSLTYCLVALTCIPLFFPF